MPWARAGLVLTVLVLASCWGCRPPPDFNCQQGAAGCPPGSYCVFQRGAEPLEWGNPSPLPGFLADSYTCTPAPERCVDAITCDCLTCTGEIDCGDDPATVPPVLCTEDEDGTVLVGTFLE